MPQDLPATNVSLVDPVGFVDHFKVVTYADSKGSSSKHDFKNQDKEVDFSN